MSPAAEARSRVWIWIWCGFGVGRGELGLERKQAVALPGWAGLRFWPCGLRRATLLDACETVGELTRCRIGTGHLLAQCSDIPYSDQARKNRDSL